MATFAPKVAMWPFAYESQRSDAAITLEICESLESDAWRVTCNAKG
jgi:hypothetical protein